MSFGKHTYGRPNIIWGWGKAKFVCGNFCSIADNVTICLGGNHNINWITTFPFGTTSKDIFNSFNVDDHGHPFTKGDVIVGNDVWIAFNVTITSGVTIGDGAVIAMNSHVVNNIEPYAIYGGNPAKLIRYRFKKEQIDKLLEIKWWNWDDEKINKIVPLLCNEDIDKFINSVLPKKIYPITFSIPESKIVDSIQPKTKLISNLIPGKLSTYIYTNETDYYNEYKQSIFATTTKKAGWDCMRHYEIMANGCIPYFPNIEKCPQNTMALLPKELILSGNKLYNRLQSKSMDDLTSDERSECKNLATELVNYTRIHLTTTKLAQYILDKSNHSSVKRILFLSGRTDPDYLRCITLHGFKILYGSECHDYPKIPHIYKLKSIDYSKLYGKGITYTNNLNPELHNDEFDKTVETDIKDKKYDIIIYGSYHRGRPFYDLVTSIYKPDEIIMLCGEDIHDCDYKYWLEKGHQLFVREF